MFEWYDLRLIDLYPQDEALDASPTAPPGVIGEPREEIAGDEGDLLPEEIKAS
jgi:hypothetical protein